MPNALAFNNFRLTSVTGTPVPDTDQVDKTTVYYEPYLGNQFSLDDGNGWAPYMPGGMSFSIAGFADGLHDIFIHLSGGSPAFDFAQWQLSSGTWSRLTSISQYDGFYNGGGSGKVLIGSIYVTSGTFQDTARKRHLANVVNMVRRPMRLTFSSSYTTSSTSYVSRNSSGSDSYLEIVTPLPSQYSLLLLRHDFSRIGAGQNGWVRMTRDGSTDMGLVGHGQNHGSGYDQMEAIWSGNLPIGVNQIYWQEKVLNAASTNMNVEIAGFLGWVEQ